MKRRRSSRAPAQDSQCLPPGCVVVSPFVRGGRGGLFGDRPSAPNRQPAAQLGKRNSPFHRPPGPPLPRGERNKQSFFVNRQERRAPALGFEESARFHDGGVLAGSQSDRARGSGGQAQDSHVVRLGTAAGEDHFLGMRRNLAAVGRPFENLPGTASGRVSAPWIGKALAPVAVPITSTTSGSSRVVALLSR